MNTADELNGLEVLSEDALDELYRAEMHAMQTLVSLDYAANGATDVAPKHVRVGLNGAFITSAAAMRIMIAKGICTKREYMVELVKETRKEIERYRKRLDLPDNVHVA